MSDVYGTGQWLTPDQVGAMATTVADLNRDLQRYAASAATSFDVSGGSSSAAATGFVNTMRRCIDLLDSHRADVESGQWSFSKWVGLATDYHKAIASALGDISDWSLSGYLSNVAQGTATDVVADAKAAAKFGLPLVAIILVAVVILKVA